jgi:hypothetical protein
MSDAVGGGASGGDQTRTAAAMIGRDKAVSGSGNGVVRHVGGIDHLELPSLRERRGGQGVGRSAMQLSEVDMSSWMSSSASRPRSYRSCAAGGR